MRTELIIPFLLLPLSTFAIPISSGSSPDTPSTLAPDALTEATVLDGIDENLQRRSWGNAAKEAAVPGRVTHEPFYSISKPYDKRPPPEKHFGPKQVPPKDASGSSKSKPPTRPQRRGWREMFRSSKPAPKERSVDGDKYPPNQQDPTPERRRKLPPAHSVSLTKVNAPKSDFSKLRGASGVDRKTKSPKSDPLPKDKPATGQGNGPPVSRRGLFSNLKILMKSKPTPPPVDFGKMTEIGDKAFYLNNPKPKLVPLAKGEQPRPFSDPPAAERRGLFGIGGKAKEGAAATEVSEVVNAGKVEAPKAGEAPKKEAPPGYTYYEKPTGMYRKKWSPGEISNHDTHPYQRRSPMKWGKGKEGAAPKDGSGASADAPVGKAEAPKKEAPPGYTYYEKPTGMYRKKWSPGEISNHDTHPYQRRR